MKGAVLFLSILVLLYASDLREAVAQQFASLNICNRSSDTLMLTSVYNEAVFFGEDWEASGWYIFEPGECREDFIESGNAIDAYFSVTIRTDQGDFVLAPGNDSIPGRILRPDWRVYNVSEFFCVLGDAFDRNGSSLAWHRNCPEDWYRILHMYRVWVSTGNSLTWTIP